MCIRDRCVCVRLSLSPFLSLARSLSPSLSLSDTRTHTCAHTHVETHADVCIFPTGPGQDETRHTLQPGSLTPPRTSSPPSSVTSPVVDSYDGPFQTFMHSFEHKTPTRPVRDRSASPSAQLVQRVRARARDRSRGLRSPSPSSTPTFVSRRSAAAAAEGEEGVVDSGPAGWT